MLRTSRRLWYVIAVAVFGLVAVASTTIHSRYQTFRDSIYRNHNLRIRSSKQEVLYRLGPPAEVLDPPERQGEYVGSQRMYEADAKNDPVNAIPEGKRIEDFDYWVYGTYPANITVEYSGNILVRITCMDQSDTPSRFCDTIAGVNIGDSEEQVVQELGNPSNYTYEGAVKTLNLDDIGVTYYLARGKVYGASIGGPVRSNFAVIQRFLGQGAGSR